jgi:hypothetical protein
MPDVLNVTVTNKVPDCTCLPDSFTLTWGIDPVATNTWATENAGGTCDIAPSTLRILLSCSGTLGSNILIFNALPDLGEILCQRPVYLHYTHVSVLNCLGLGNDGYADFTITE